MGVYMEISPFKTRTTTSPSMIYYTALIGCSFASIRMRPFFWPRIYILSKLVLVGRCFTICQLTEIDLINKFDVLDAD